MPVSDCPNCGAALPAYIVTELERIFVPQRPVSLTFQMFLGFIVGFFMLINTYSAFQPMDLSVFEMLGIHMEAPSPMIRGTLNLCEALLLLFSSYCLYKNDMRSRISLMFLIFLLTVPETMLVAPMMEALEVGRAIYAVVAGTSLLCLVLAYVYLYHWKHAIRYYAAIRYLADRRNTPSE